jgi:hypothetical protein
MPQSAFRPHGGRNVARKIQKAGGFAAGRPWPSASCSAALTMIKKALPAAFPLMPQADRISDQLAGILWTILWKFAGVLWTL